MSNPTVLSWRWWPLALALLLLAASDLAAQEHRGGEKGEGPAAASDTCFRAVQGKIAWDQKGTKQWNSSNVADLCRGAETSDQPARCFDRAMHGGISRGDGTDWEWTTARDLCRGSTDANATIKCFQSEIAKGKPWKEAIESCAQGPGRVWCSQAGPQAPRDIGSPDGENPVTFAKAPPVRQMRLCDIHFHKFAEHRAAGYPRLAGSGEHTGYVCREAPVAEHDGSSASDEGCEGIALGDTVEVHWVFTTCNTEPAPGLGSCLKDCVKPQLRVEARVFLLTTDGDDFREIADQPADFLLRTSRNAVEYLGSTTGPSFNPDGVCSAYQATWNVAPGCGPLIKDTLDEWCGHNVFKENHAHGVRRLVTDPGLLSEIH